MRDDLLELLNNLKKRLESTKGGSPEDLEYHNGRRYELKRTIRELMDIFSRKENL